MREQKIGCVRSPQVIKYMLPSRLIHSNSPSSWPASCIGEIERYMHVARSATSWQYEAERCPTAYFAFDEDLSLVRFNDLFHYCKAKTEPALLYRIGLEFLKDLCKTFW